MAHSEEKSRRVITEQYLLGSAGLVHRENGPAITVKYPDGSVLKKYALHGQWHREGGPAIVRFSPSGNIRSEEFWLNGARVDRRRVVTRKPHRAKTAHAK